MALYRWPDTGGVGGSTILRRAAFGNKLARTAACCCGNYGCCEGVLIPLTGQTLLAEIIDATNNCVSIGSTTTLSEGNSLGGPAIWASLTPIDPYCICTCLFECGHDPVTLEPRLHLGWVPGTNPPNQPFCPAEAYSTTTLISLTCEPFEAIFYISLNQTIASICPCCYDGFTGTFTVRITLLP